MYSLQRLGSVHWQQNHYKISQLLKNKIVLLVCREIMRARTDALLKELIQVKAHGTLDGILGTVANFDINVLLIV